MSGDPSKTTNSSDGPTTSSDAPTTRRRARRRVAAAVAVVALGVGAFVAFTWMRSAGADVNAAAVLSIDENGFRYAYQVVTGDEALYDLRVDPQEIRNVLAEHAALAVEMRRSLATKLHVDDLDAIRRERAEKIQRLKALGYL